MITIQAYSVLDKVVVSVSCHHGADLPAGSHLVYRTQMGAHDGSLAEVLEAVVVAVGEAARLVCHGDVESYDDCAMA